MGKNKFLLLLFCVVLLSPLSMAELVLEQGTESNVTFSCINNGYCSSSTVCNVSIISPSEIILRSGVQATQSLDLANFNVTLNSTQTSELGEYNVRGFCKDGSISKAIDFSFDVTPLGDKIETPESILYTVLLIVNFVLFLIFFTFSILIPFKNETNEEGAITSINKLKYLKLLCMLFTYGIFLWFLTLVTGITNNYIFFDKLKGLITNLYLIFYTLGWGLTVFMVWFIFVSLWKDILINKEIVKFGKAFLKKVD